VDGGRHHPRLPASALALLAGGLLLGVLAVTLVVAVGALGLLLTAPSIVLIAIGAAIAGKRSSPE
jgi:hypothetical protein